MRLRTSGSSRIRVAARPDSRTMTAATASTRFGRRSRRLVRLSSRRTITARTVSGSPVDDDIQRRRVRVERALRDEEAAVGKDGPELRRQVEQYLGQAGPELVPLCGDFRRHEPLL